MSAIAVVDSQRVPWRTATLHALLYLVSFLFVTFALALPVGVGYFVFNLLRGGSLAEISLHLEDSLLYLNVLIAAGQLLAAIALAALWMRFLDKRGTVREFGWRWKGSRTGVAFVAGLGMSALALGVYALLGRLALLGFAWQTESLWDVLVIDVLGFVPLLLLMVVTEELMFRGYIRWVFPESSAALGSAVFYGIYRVVAWRFFGDTRAQGLDTLLIVGVSGIVAGLMLAWLWRVNKSLWTPISLRLGWALLLGVIFSLSVNGKQVEGLLLTRVGGGFVTGGSGGPEAGLLGIAVWLLAWGILYRLSRARSKRS